MSKEKRIHQHNFVDKHPVLGAIIAIVLGLFGSQLLGSVLDVPLILTMPGYPQGGFIGAVVCAFIALAIFKRWFYPEFEGNLRGGDPKTGIRLSLFILIYWGITFPIQFLFTPAVFGMPTLNSVAIAVIAGVLEEIAFRGLPLSLLMRQWREEKKILTAMILTSVIFGVIHMANALAGANFGSTIIQAIGATAIGFFLCGIYLRCGNLWITIIVHALHDLLCFLDVRGIQNGIVVDSVTWFSFLDLACCIGLATIGFWMVRPSKRAEIRQLWNRKWNITDAPEDANTAVEPSAQAETY